MTQTIYDTLYQEILDRKYKNFKSINNENLDLDKVFIVNTVHVNLVHAAIIHRTPKILNYLLTLGASPDTCIYGDPALLVAIKTRNIKIVNILLNHNADVNKPGREGVSLLAVSIKWSMTNYEIPKLLIEFGADINYNIGSTSILSMFCNLPNSLEVVKLLFDKGVRHITNYEEGFSDPPIMSAIDSGNLEIVKFLFERGADINISNSYYTPLSKASSNGYIDIVKFLVENGAIIETKNKRGMNALMEASKYNYTEIVKFLVDRGARVDVEIAKESPLIYAAMNKNYDLLKYFIEILENKN